MCVCWKAAEMVRWFWSECVFNICPLRAYRTDRTQMRWSISEKWHWDQNQEVHTALRNRITQTVYSLLECVTCLWTIYWCYMSPVLKSYFNRPEVINCPSQSNILQVLAFKALLSPLPILSRQSFSAFINVQLPIINWCVQVLNLLALAPLAVSFKLCGC